MSYQQQKYIICENLNFLSWLTKYSLGSLLPFGYRTIKLYCSILKGLKEPYICNSIQYEGLSAVRVQKMGLVESGMKKIKFLYLLYKKLSIIRLKNKNMLPKLPKI